MGKKSTSEKIGEGVGTVVGLALVAIVIVLVIAMVALPFVLFFGTIIYAFRFSSSKRKLNNDLGDFWLSQEDRTDFKRKFSALQECTNLIEDAERRGNEAGISRNMDGSFSARSNLGKEIRQIFSKYKPAKQKLTAQLNQLQHVPLERWKQFNSKASYYKAFCIGLPTWVCVVGYYVYLGISNETIGAQLGEIFGSVLVAIPSLGLWLLSYGDLDLPPEQLQMSAMPFLASVLVFFITKAMYSNYGAKFSPKPPLVTLKNIDLPSQGQEVFQENSTPPLEEKSATTKHEKKKSIAIISALFLGFLGIHKFYLGSWGWGLLYLLLVGTGLTAILGIADAIRYMFMSKEKFDKVYNSSPKRPFKW